MAWEPDRRSNSFFSPPAHLCAVTYMTEISLIVTLNNQFTHSLTQSRFVKCVGHSACCLTHPQILLGAQSTSVTDLITNSVTCSNICLLGNDNVLPVVIAACCGISITLSLRDCTHATLSMHDRHQDVQTLQYTNITQSNSVINSKKRSYA